MLLYFSLICNFILVTNDRMYLTLDFSPCSYKLQTVRHVLVRFYLNKPNKL